MKTKKVLLTSAIISMAITTVFAQEGNTDLNFSKIEKTPKKLAKIELANGWDDANRGTADLFHKEGNRKTGIPNNQLGTQEAFKGDGYAGIIACLDDIFINRKGKKIGYGKYSEYIQSKLTQPLVANQQYDVVFYVNLADKSGRAVNDLGIYFSKNAVTTESNSFLKYKPQVSSSEVINDKNKWTPIKGRFTAKGGEQFITLGLFNGVNKIERAAALNETNNKRAYYYIDGITVTPFIEPDSDNDGVIDKEDKCPNESGLADLGGCPDADGDGVTDKEDTCPTQKGSKDLGGCPDTDADGLADKDDACPEVAGLLENKGCPKVKEAVLKVFEKALNGVKFQSGRDKLTSSSLPILNQVVQIMKDNPTYNLKINGHTDSSGDDVKNLELSKKRSAAVEAYLIKKEIESTRLSSEGFGETIPVADNKTSKGRALNRRVELKVEFTKLIK